MFNTSPKEALPPMRSGERESRAGGEQYCLSPLPLPVDSEHGVDVANIDVRHDDVTMDIRQGASPESLMTAGHVASGLSLCMILLFLILWAGLGGYSPGFQLMTFFGGGVIFCFSKFLYSRHYMD
nr:hypothetical protein [Halomonas sp. 1513]